MMGKNYPSLGEFLFPGVLREHWQMMPSEQIALTGLLARIRPKLSLEIGVYYGGSLSLTAQYAEKVIAIDIDPAVRDRFEKPTNVDIRIGDSTVLIPEVLTEITESGAPLGFVFIDAEHSAKGVRRDIELVLQYRPIAPMIILIHDSGNPDCRSGIKSAGWASNPYVAFVDCDFVPAQVIEHTVRDGRGEIWGGFALGYLTPEEREGDIVISESAITSISALHAVGRSILSTPA